MNLYILMEDDGSRDMPILASFKKKYILKWLKDRKYKHNKEHGFYYLPNDNEGYEYYVRIEKTVMIGEEK